MSSGFAAVMSWLIDVGPLLCRFTCKLPPLATLMATPLLTVRIESVVELDGEQPRLHRLNHSSAIMRQAFDWREAIRAIWVHKTGKVLQLSCGRKALQ